MMTFLPQRLFYESEANPLNDPRFPRSGLLAAVQLLQAPSALIHKWHDNYESSP